MSRKTRKLIWSAPLVAVLAVAGALAMFAAQGTGSVFANPLPAAPSNLEVTAATGNDGKDGRTMLVLNWDEPAGGNVTGYRIDKSTDRFVWENLVMDTGNGNTTYTDATLTADDLRWYRVFALNDHGVGEVSNFSSHRTNDKGMPGSVRNLTATPDAAAPRDKLNLTWDPPSDDGGEKIIGYEIQYYDTSAADSIWRAFETGSGDGTTTKVEDPEYSHEGLDPGDEVDYRVRAVSGPQDLPVGTDTIHDETADDADEDEARVHVSEKWVEETGTTASATLPGRVTGLTAVPTAATMIQLHWWAPEDTGGWPISHFLIQAKSGRSWPDVPNEAQLKAMTAAGAATMTVGNTGNTEMASALIPLAEATVVQATIRSDTFDHDGDTGTPDAHVEWDFRVYAVTTDDGADPDDAATGDDVRRMSAKASDTRSATAAARPDPDLYGSPTVAASGSESGGTITGGMDGLIELTITPPSALVDTDQIAYRIDYSDDGGDTWKLLLPDTSATNFDATARLYQDRGLDYDQERHYRVFAIEDNYLTSVGQVSTPPGGAEGWTMASEPPQDAPTGVTAVAPDLETIMASWTAPEDDGGQPITNYRYRYVIDDGDDQPDENDFAGTDNRPIGMGSTGNANLMATIDVDADPSTTAVNEPLSEEMTYWFQVSGINENPLDSDAERPALADAMWSTAVSFSTGEATVPNAVEGLMSQQAIDATPGTDRGVLLMWNKPSSGPEPTGYEVELQDTDGEWVLPRPDADEVPASRTSYTDPDELDEDEVRLYRVRAKNEAGEGPWTMVYYPREPAAHADHMLGDASGLTAVNNGDGTVTLSWTPGPNSNIHWVAAARRDGAGFNTGAGSTVWEKADMAASHTVDVSNLHAGTYAFTVIAGQYNADTGTENWDTNWTAFEDASAP